MLVGNPFIQRGQVAVISQEAWLVRSMWWCVIGWGKNILHTPSTREQEGLGEGILYSHIEKKGSPAWMS